MEIKTQGMILTAVSKAYNMHGNEGVSHRVRVLVGGDIYVCKSNADEVLALQPSQGLTGSIVLKLRSPKEVLALEFVSFQVVK